MTAENEGVLDFVTTDRGTAVITWEMQISHAYPDKAKELEEIMLTRFPHLVFWVGERISDRAMIIDWEPREIL